MSEQAAPVALAEPVVVSEPAVGAAQEPAKGAVADPAVKVATDGASPPAGKSEAPGAAATLVAGAVEDKPVATVPDWPDDWRVKMAGEDKGYLKTLERYGSPAELAKAHRELQVKLSSGQLKTTLKADATPEETATWRKENGLPDKPEAYEAKLPGGIVLGEADAPLLKGFQETAFKANMSPGQFNEALTWYFAEQDAVQAKQFEADRTFKLAAEDDLRKEWGAGYRGEVASIQNFLALAPDGVAERLFSGRTADGKLIGDDPAVLRWLASLSREANPMASLVPAGSADPMKAGADRIKEIEGMMAKGDSAYWRDDAVQAEYRSLIDARNKTQSRQAA